jgi:hypothetical protein
MIRRYDQVAIGQTSYAEVMIALTLPPYHTNLNSTLTAYSAAAAVLDSAPDALLYIRGAPDSQRTLH